MDDKKFVPFKIIHLFLVLCALAINAIGMIADNSAFGNSPLTIVDGVLCELALVIGFIYIAFGYKKNAAIFYKLFMVATVAVAIIEAVNIITLISVPVYVAFIYLIALVILTTLAVATDFGELRTTLFAIALMVLRMALIVLSFNVIKQMPTALMGFIGNDIAMLFLTATLCLMVYGKYIDKESRGTK